MMPSFPRFAAFTANHVDWELAGMKRATLTPEKFSAATS